MKIMKYLVVFFSFIVLISCGGKEEAVTPDTTSELIDDYEKIEGQHYRAYYGSNDQLKIEGYYDHEGKRHGIWTHYTVQGKKQSVTEYNHGVKDGYSIVYHPNGSLYYRGEYQNDQMVGVWDFYDTNTGEKSHTKDYGYPKQ